MSNLQVKFGLTFGSGDKGLEFERRLRQAAEKEGKPFPAWIKETLAARAELILTPPLVTDGKKKKLTEVS